MSSSSSLSSSSSSSSSNNEEETSDRPVKAEKRSRVKKVKIEFENDDDTEDAENAVQKRLKPAGRQPPAEWERVWALIQEMRSKTVAPVDTEGCEALADKSDPKNFRLQTLVSLMLSSQTKDSITAAAMRRLQTHPKGTLDLELLRNLSSAELTDLLFGVGFYRKKAEYIKQTAELLHTKFDGDIPNTLDGLCSLPGVGPKMAHLCMQVAWGQTVGIGVDVHVHRISNRLHWVKNTNTPEASRKQLEEWLPQTHWRDINKLLVGFGQTICSPLKPKCENCSLAEAKLCPSSQVRRQKSKVKLDDTTEPSKTCS